MLRLSTRSDSQPTFLPAWGLSHKATPILSPRFAWKSRAPKQGEVMWESLSVKVRSSSRGADGVEVAWHGSHMPLK